MLFNQDNKGGGNNGETRKNAALHPSLFSSLTTHVLLYSRNYFFASTHSVVPSLFQCAARPHRHKIVTDRKAGRS